jgi:hypothetical protein
MKPRRRRVERIYRLHVERDRQKIARLLFQGLSTAKIATRVKCSPDNVRDMLHSPEFQTLYAQYEREQLDVIDRAEPVNKNETAGSRV